jgi:hypothetical protein
LFITLSLSTLNACAQGNLIANGTYTIASKNSGQVVDVYNNSLAAGADIDQWASNGGNNQKWQLTNLGSNYVELVNVNSGMALDVYQDSTANGAVIDQWPYNSGKNQIWQVVSKGSGYYELISENSGLALDVEGASKTEGTYLDQWTPSGNANQLWSFTSVPGGGGGVAATVTVNQKSSGPAVTDQILGMNMAYWYDQSNSAIVPALETAGIKALRWPGGSGSDLYHWQSNSLCNGGYTFPAASWTTWLADVVDRGNFDVAVTADYGTNTACNAGGNPSEAAAWVTSARQNGNHVSHWTIGNEVYGSWETDLHVKKNDPGTYANAVATGFYPQMKAANSNTLVGVVVEPGNSPAWDPIVLSQAKYDFVEYHFYAQAPGGESDTYLVQQAAQQLTTELNAVKADLASAGHSSTPIYVGELGSVYGMPGVQSTSITQALYAGQVLGELMNDGVSRATWWIGFGGCDQGAGFNFSSSLYGWQNYGGYMVFSDGLPEGGCSNTPNVPAGTLLPTARAFQLFSNVAKSGEHVLSNSVSGDTTDVRAYASTNEGGTAIVLFNLNENNSESVKVTLSSQTTATSVSVETYDKAIYDQSKNNVWAGPTTTNLGSQSLPLTLTLAPWSMNVVTIH